MKKLMTFFMIVFLVIGIIPGNLTLNAAQQKIGMSGRVHIQNFGNRDGKIVNEKGIETLVLGTRGMSKRLESVAIKFTNNTGYFGSIEYQVHVQNIGWMPWVSNGQSAGTQGQSKRLEGIRIRLTGDLANYYDVRYSTHIQLYGDAQGWVYNGGLAGTTGESKRLEELKIQIIPKKTINEEPYVTYRTHVQTYGWERTWKKYGGVAGTTGQAKRLEGIEVRLNDNTYGGGIEYKTHIQSYGWQGYCRNGEMSGTQGQSKRLEAIEVRLTGNIANYYDVYYRVHAQNFGWMGWSKNGERAGTAGYSYRLEAIQIKLIRKNGAAPKNDGNITAKYKERKWVSAHYENKWVVDKAAWDEPVYKEFEYVVCNGFDKAVIINGEVRKADGAKDCNKKFYTKDYYEWKYGYYDENDPNMSRTAHAIYEETHNTCNFSHGGYHGGGLYDKFKVGTVHHKEEGHYEKVYVEGYWKEIY